MKSLVFIFFVLLSFPSHAVWLNSSGEVTSIITYAGKDTVLVNLSTAGTAVQECASTATFAISSTLSAEQRARMFAILLAAKTAGSKVTISYNDVGSCEPWDSNPNAYRKIIRLSAIQ